jgi:hypothetical protein
MKSKNRINYLIGFWLFYILVDSFCGLLRSWQSKDMNVPVRFFFRTIFLVRGAVVFFIAVLNFLLIAKHRVVPQS